jgi:hypothetical protein
MKTQNEITIEKLVEQTNIPSELVRAVVDQFGGWDDFTACAFDVCLGGIDGGFNGFIYNAETEKFARENRKAIAKLASEQAANSGVGVFEMIRGFGCFKGDKLSDEEIGAAMFAGEQGEDSPNILNAMAWYAGEEVCREYARMADPDNY